MTRRHALRQFPFLMKFKPPLTSSILHGMFKKRRGGHYERPVTIDLSRVEAMGRGLLSSSRWEAQFGYALTDHSDNLQSPVTS
jgi:hypothetical protein